jgi:hypothetical protein
MNNPVLTLLWGGNCCAFMVVPALFFVARGPIYSLVCPTEMAVVLVCRYDCFANKSRATVSYNIISLTHHLLTEGCLIYLIPFSVHASTEVPFLTSLETVSFIPSNETLLPVTLVFAAVSFT